MAVSVHLLPLLPLALALSLSLSLSPSPVAAFWLSATTTAPAPAPACGRPSRGAKELEAARSEVSVPAAAADAPPSSTSSTQAPSGALKAWTEEPATVVTTSTSTTHGALDSIRTAMEPAMGPTQQRQLRHPKKKLPMWLIAALTGMLGAGGLLTCTIRCCNNNRINFNFRRLPPPVEINLV